VPDGAKGGYRQRTPWTGDPGARGVATPISLILDVPSTCCSWTVPVACAARAPSTGGRTPRLPLDRGAEDR